jgi:phosphoglycerate dehydrogenase-like enzyme
MARTVTHTEAVHVLVLSNFTDDWLERLRATSPTLDVQQHGMFAPVEAIPDDVWAEIEVLFTFRTFRRPHQAPRLRWIQLNNAGAERALDEPICQDAQIQLTNLSGITAVPIAEHVFTLLLTWSHRVPRLLSWQTESIWPRQDEVRTALADLHELYGQTLGIVGYGSIGRQVARLARAFGMRVLALQRGTDRRDHGYAMAGTGDPEGALPERFYAPAALHELLGESDVVVLTLPSTAATRGLIDEPALRAMRPSGLLVNVGRGSAVDQVALERALREGWIAGAALDVVEHEPLPADHPLWRMPNVLLTPHIAGITPRYEDRAAALFLENLRRYVADAPLLNVIDRARGY